MTIWEIAYFLVGFLLGMFWIAYIKDCLNPKKLTDNNLIH